MFTRCANSFARCYCYVFCRQDTLEKARDKCRIKSCNIMLVLTVIGCIVMVISGKQAAKRGESVVKMNQEFHRQYNENAARKEQEEKVKHTK